MFVKIVIIENFFDKLPLIALKEPRDTLSIQVRERERERERERHTEMYFGICNLRYTHIRKCFRQASVLFILMSEYRRLS